MKACSRAFIRPTKSTTEAQSREHIHEGVALAKRRKPGFASELSGIKHQKNAEFFERLRRMLYCSHSINTVGLGH